MGSIDATWGSLQLPEGLALLQIIVAAHHDPELAARIADFARRFEDGLSRGAQRLADAAGLRTDKGEALEERRFTVATLRGLSLEMMLNARPPRRTPSSTRCGRNACDSTRAFNLKIDGG